jgi:hypothetical protein
MDDGRGLALLARAGEVDMSRPYRRPPKPDDWLQARLKRGLSAVEAAAVIDVDPSTWRGWESGKHTGPPYGLRCFELECDLAEDCAA